MKKVTKKTYTYPLTLLLSMEASMILAGSNNTQKPDKETTTDEQNAKDNTSGNLWDE